MCFHYFPFIIFLELSFVFVLHIAFSIYYKPDALFNSVLSLNRMLAYICSSNERIFIVIIQRSFHLEVNARVKYVLTREITVEADY